MPFDRAQIGREDRRIVGAVAPQAGPEIILDPPGADLRLPRDLQRLSPPIIRDAGEIQRGKTLALVVDALDQPRAVADLDNITELRSLVVQCASVIRRRAFILPERLF